MENGKVAQLPEIRFPSTEFDIPAEWLKFDSLDDDNLRFHMQESASQQAYVAGLFADCEFYYQSFELAARQMQAKVYLQFKAKPYRRWLTKLKGYMEVDASDTVCEMVSKADILSNEYLKAALAWKRHRDRLRGQLQAFDTKQKMLTTLGGLRRDELQAVRSEH